MIFDPVGLSLRILRREFSGGTVVGLPYHIEITDNFIREGDGGYYHKLNYTFYNHYPKSTAKKPVQTVNDTYRTDTFEDLSDEYTDSILNKIKEEFGKYRWYEQFIFKKESISQGKRIIINLKNGS